MNPGSFINFDTLNTIEIIKGPASALYGSDALGGVISFESLEANDLLGDNEDFKVEIPVNYNSSNNGFNGSTKIATKLSENTSALFIFTTENSDETDVKTESKYLDNTDNFPESIQMIVLHQSKQVTIQHIKDHTHLRN